EDARGREPALPLGADTRQGQVPRVPGGLLARELGPRLDERREGPCRGGHSTRSRLSPALPPALSPALSPRATRPSGGDDARACSRRGGRPARAASYPASTARRIARAMRTGSAARVTAVASSTPSHPSSMARAASDAVPM